QATTPNLDSTGPSSTITVTASQLVFTTFPTAAVQSDHNFTVVVSAEDILGNTAGNFTDSINLQTHSGPAFKDFGNGTAVAGQAQFINVTLTTTGVYTLVASDVTNPGNPPNVISPSLSITASKVHFVVQPPPVVKSGAPFSVEVDAVGEDNSLDTSFFG